MSMRFLLIAALCSAGVHAQGAKNAFAGDPRAKKAIEDAVAALGGPKFLSMQDRVESGRAYSFYRDKISGLSLAVIYTHYLPVPENKTGQDLAVREREAF